MDILIKITQNFIQHVTMFVIRKLPIYMFGSLGQYCALLLSVLIDFFLA